MKKDRVSIKAQLRFWMKQIETQEKKKELQKKEETEEKHERKNKQ